MDQRPWLRQQSWSNRFEWGATGVRLVPADAVVVDVLRFTTAIDAGVSAGALVYPFRWNDQTTQRFAEEHHATLADPVGLHGPSLSPVSLQSLLPGTRVVLPSPNGSTCAAVAYEAGASVYAACLRNASAVGEWVADHHETVTVIACGERWPDETLRPALEDYLGAAAVLSAMKGSCSPEANAAARAWRDARPTIATTIAECVSGCEATTRGWQRDLSFACEVDVSSVVPILRDGVFIDGSRSG